MLADLFFFVNNFFLSMFQLKHSIVEKQIICCFLKEKAYIYYQI